MKKLALLLILLSTFSTVKAQETDKEIIERTAKAAERLKEETTDGWKKVGTISFLFNQSAFNNNWSAGGISSYSGNLTINYNFNYKRNNWVLDNKIFGAYGLTQIKGAANAVKSDDRLEFTSIAGRKAGGYWYYSAFLNFKTQMDSGFDALNIKTSHFLSPAYLQFGPGMLWKKSDNLKFNITPASTRFIFVDKQFTKLGSAYGVLQGKDSRVEFGASLAGYYKLNLMENVSMENILNLYSNYLDKPQNVDVDYQMNLIMKVNKYISANLSFQTIYDDNTVQAVQVREVFGLGVNYGF